MAESNEIREEPVGPSVATAEQQPTSQVSPFEDLLQRVSSSLDAENLKCLCNFYGYCTENRNFATAFELFQFLEVHNLWGCGTLQEKKKVLTKRIKMLGNIEALKITQTFSVHTPKKLRRIIPHSLNHPEEASVIPNSSVVSPLPSNTSRRPSRVDFYSPVIHRRYKLNKDSSQSSNTSDKEQAIKLKDAYTFKEENVHVLECDAKFYTDHKGKSDEVYPIRHCSPKAHVLILNNYKGFKGGPEHDRHGAEIDGELMKQLWEGFQCNVKVEENQTAEKMWQKLEKFSTNDFHESCDFCVVFIMSHGNSNKADGHEYVYGIDDATIENDEVIKLFKNSKDRPHLIGKPKLIFFQSCRGESAARGVPLSSTDIPPPNIDQADNIKKKTIPEDCDILVAYPTAKDMKAFRIKVTGSWFINAIAKVFSKKAKTEHVVDMLTEVKNLMSQQIAYAPGTEHHRCQVSAVTQDSLRKKLYLFPGFPKTNN